MNGIEGLRAKRPDFGMIRTEWRGTTLECKAIASGITMQDLTNAYEKAVAEASPADSLAGNPSLWPESRGAMAIANMLLDAIYSAPDPRIAELEAEVARLRALQWMPDEFGRPERALYLGGIFVGYVQELKPVRATWRAWLMVDLDGSDAGERDTENEAKDLLLRAARAALENKP